jgi:hypothetical protein
LISGGWFPSRLATVLSTFQLVDGEETNAMCRFQNKPRT